MIRDVNRKRLTLMSLTYPVATLKRFVKYARKGYDINKAAVQFVRSISELAADGIGFTDGQMRFYVD